MQTTELATGASVRLLEQLAESIRLGSVEVKVATDWDYPASDAILRAAIRFQADLVVVECHRATHPFPWFLHFTDWDLVRCCPLPLLLVKGAKPYHRSAVLSAVDPVRTHTKPADLDAEILRFGSGLATALGGALHAVHAYNFADAAADLAAQGGSVLTQEAVTAQASEPVNQLLDKMGMPVEHRHVVEGQTPDAVEGVMRDLEAQILVMGAISRSGAKRLLIGDTAERMLDRITCDILIVKPPGFCRPISVAPRGRQVIVSPALSAAIGALARPLTGRA
jgi:universal stress protein E